MNVKIHEAEGFQAAEVEEGSVIIGSVEDALDLMVNPAMAGIRNIIIRRENLAPAFFDLHTGFAGEVLQKFVNYGRRLAIVGDYGDIPSENFQAFIRESNRGKQILFSGSSEAAVASLRAEQ